MRRIITGVVAAGLVVLNFLFVTGVILAAPPAATVPPSGNGATRIGALSLRVLKDRLAHAPRRESPEQAGFPLGNLTSLLGYVVDRESHDLILYGYAEPGAPAVVLDDLVVALRNTWLKYAPLRGNTRWYSFPGCSIDPNDRTVEKLQDIGRQLHEDAAGTRAEELVQAWCQRCQEPQAVRVLGVPFDTRFARVMVDADYDMKSLVDGSQPLDVPGFLSITDATLARAQLALDRNEPLTLAWGSMDRFWFCPAPGVYEYAEDIVLMQQCPVQVLTEAMRLSTTGQLVNAQQTTAEAETFARSFSRLLPQVARARPIYRELENLFRAVAVAKLLRCTNAPTEAGLDLEYFLTDFPVGETQVARSLPGRAAVRRFERRIDRADGYLMVKMWLPSCGGVAIEINPQQADLRPNSGGLLSRLRAAIRRARPAPDALYWELGASPDLAGELLLSHFIGGANRSSSHITTLAVRSEEGRYAAYQGADDPGCRSDDTRGIIDWILNKRSEKPRDAIYVLMKGFPTEDKVRAFETTAQLALRQRFPGVKLRALRFEEPAAGLQMACLSPGFRLDPQAPPTLGETGGEMQCTIHATIKAQGRPRDLQVTFRSRVRQVLERIRSSLEGRSREPDTWDASLMDFLAEIRSRLKEAYPNLTDEELDIRVRDEISGIEISMWWTCRHTEVA